MSESCFPRGRRSIETPDESSGTEPARKSAEMPYAGTEDLCRSSPLSDKANPPANARLLAALSIPILLIDDSLTIVFANRAWGKISSHYEEILGRQASELFPDKQSRASFLRSISSILMGRPASDTEGQIRIGTSEMWARMSVQLLRVGNERSILAAVEDLTKERMQLLTIVRKEMELLQVRAELKEANRRLAAEPLTHDIADNACSEDELRKARREAEAGSRAKREFLANVSHELRTPLNSIIGFAEILHDQFFGKLNKTQLGHVRYVLDSGRHLLELINNIIDLASAESGGMEIQISAVDIRRLLETSMVLIAERARRHGLRTTLRVADELTGVKIEADEPKLKRIVFNLLSNAIKFTPTGGEVFVRAQTDGVDLTVRVTDTGIGLKPEDQRRVFRAFEQVDSSHNRAHQGTGLGLALTKRMVELHGGRLWVESGGEGQGCTFTFTVPLCSPLPDERLT